MMNQQPEAQPDLVVGDENYLKIDHLSTLAEKAYKDNKNNLVFDILWGK